MKRPMISAAALLFALFLIGWARAEDISGSLTEIVPLQGNSFSCICDGVKHKFIVDLPEQTGGAPLVLLLPGYGNTAESFRTSIGFEQEANTAGYAAVYVTGARDPNDPLSSIGWNAGQGIGGNDDVRFLTALAKYLQQEYSFDEQRTFAVGFSNGAFMAHRLAMEAGDTFAACVSVAGRMPAKIWDARSGSNGISFFQITGEKDDVVPKNSDGSSKFSKDPAIEDVMAYRAASCGLESSVSEEIGNGSELIKFRSEQTRDQVWHLLVKGGRHSWPSEKQNGIDTNSLILEFFEAVSH